MPSSEDRRGRYKPTESEEDGRKRRQGKLLSLRKEARDHTIAKRRQTGPPTVGAPRGDVDIGAMAEAVRNRQLYCGMDTLGVLTTMRDVMNVDPYNLDLATEIVRLEIPRIIIHLPLVDQPSQVQHEAIWIMLTIASHVAPSHLAQAVVDAGSIPALVQMLSGGCPQVQMQSAWCLANIAGDRAAFRDDILISGAMPLLIDLSRQTKSRDDLVVFVWAISTLCRSSLLLHFWLVTGLSMQFPPVPAQHPAESALVFW
eukprot:gene12675-2318_t